jgi:hypothetical protein
MLAEQADDRIEKVETRKEYLRVCGAARLDCLEILEKA